MGAFFVSADSKEVTWFSMEILGLRADEAGTPLRTRILVGCSVTDAFYGSVHCKGLSGEWRVNLRKGDLETEMNQKQKRTGMRSITQGFYSTDWGGCQ